MHPRSIQDQFKSHCSNHLGRRFRWKDVNASIHTSSLLHPTVTTSASSLWNYSHSQGMWYTKTSHHSVSIHAIIQKAHRAAIAFIWPLISLTTEWSVWVRERCEFIHAFVLIYRSLSAHCWTVLVLTNLLKSRCSSSGVCVSYQTASDASPPPSGLE